MKFYVCASSHQPQLEPKYNYRAADLSFLFLVHKPDVEMSFCFALSYTQLIVLCPNTMDNVELTPCHKMQNNATQQLKIT